MGEPAYQLPDEDQPDIKPRLTALEGGGETTPRQSGHLRSAGGSDTKSIAGAEAAGSKSDKTGDYGNSALDDINGKLGRGYNDNEKKTVLSRAFNGKSKLKKKLAIAGAVAGIGTGISVFIFVALLPLKLEHIISNLEARYSAAANDALGKETNNLLKGYITKYLIPSMVTKKCRSTVDASCVVTVAGDGPVAQMYKAWKNDKFEKKLSKYGLSFGRSGNTYYINTNNKKIDFSSPEKMADWINDPDTNSGSRSDIERAYKQFLREQTLWVRIYHRFVVAPFIKDKVGVRHCIGACSKINEFSDKVGDKKRAAKAYMLDRVLSPLSENYAFIMQCILVGAGGCNVTNLEDAEEGDTTRESESDKKMRERLRSYAANFSEAKLADLVQKSRDLEDKGFSKYFVEKMVAGAVSKLAGEGAGTAAGAATTKAIPVVGWVLLFVQLADTARNLGPMIKYMSYAATAAAAAQTFAAYQTLTSETHSGEIDPTQLGSFSSALETSLDTSDLNSLKSADNALKEMDDGTHASDASQTPLYQAIMDPSGPSGTTASVFSSLASGTAYAASSDTNEGYLCDDGKPVPSGKIVCDEEVFGGLTKIGGVAAQVSGWYNAYTQMVPGLSLLIDGLQKVNDFAGWAVGNLLGWIEGPACGLFDKVSPGSPCDGTKNLIKKYGGKLISFMTDKMLLNPFKHLSGGRLFDMLAGGASYTFNSSTQENLGAAYIDDSTSAKIQTAYLNEQQQQFEERPFFARMFSTDTSYSFVSKVALAMPSSLSLAGNNMLASVQQSPLSVVSKMFAGMMSFGRVSAASSEKVANPFNVPQSGYLDSQIPSDPEKYWKEHCVNGPEGVWHENNPVGKQLDISAWLNYSKGNEIEELSRSLQNPDAWNELTRDGVIAKGIKDKRNVVQDPETGQAIYLNPNPCSLILSSVQSAGGLADPSLLPSISGDTSTNGIAGGAKFRIASYNALGASHTDPGGNSNLADWSDRVTKIVDNVESQKIDIIGFQELEPRQQKYLDTHLTGYERSSKGKSSDSIMWRASCSGGTDCASFTKVGQGTWETTYFSGAIDEPWVKLKDNSTQQEFYVMNVHDPINNGKGNATTRYNNALKHLEQIKKLQKDAPVLFTGDFNNGYKKSDGSGMPSDQKTTYCVLTSSGLMHDSYDLVSDRGEKCPNPTTRKQTGVNSMIDHIYASSGLDVAKYFDIPKPQSGSDHVVVISDVVIPSASGAGANFSLATWNLPVTKKDGYASAEDQWRIGVNSILTYKNTGANTSDSGIDIVGFQETGRGNFNYYKQHMTGYGSYPAKFAPQGRGHDGTCAASQAIFYKQSQFTFIKGSYLEFPRYVSWQGKPCGNNGEVGKTGYAHAPIVWLQNSKGQQIIVMNTHNVANVKASRGSNAAKIRYEANKLYIQKIQELKAENPGVPIFLTGDFNEGTDVRATGNATYQGKRENLIFCMFAKNGLMKSAAGPAMRCDPKYSVGGVDYIYIPPETQATTKLIKKPKNGSDHGAAIVANISVAGKDEKQNVAGKNVTKVLTIVEENHSLPQMKKSMPYAMSLAKQYGYATNYKATTHPSLPNYIAIAGGGTFGVNGDGLPKDYNVNGTSVFGQAISRGKTAKLYAESMTKNCDATADGRGSKYRTKHNPWAYFKNERALCNKYDVPFKQFARDVSAGKLPNVGMVVPNMCNDAHDCSLATADNWFKQLMQTVFNGPDWKSGHLAVVLTADEDNRKPANGNDVLTVVIHPSLQGKVVSTALNHYSLSKFYSETVGASGVSNKVNNATSLAQSFGLEL